MIDPALPVLAGWENFYVIIGSSAAALIGLQFVVIALIKDTRTRTTSGTISAFGTPTVVHLGGALVVSAFMSAPWTAWSELSFALGICGLVGLGYGTVVIIQARNQSGYTPVFEDWLWHSILPCLAYAAFTASALFFHASPRGSSFAVAAASLGLLLIAIHNAWDTVTYIVLQSVDDRGTPPGDSPGDSPAR
jgi:hypothetical protein